jgi:hypothetical protein
VSCRGTNRARHFPPWPVELPEPLLPLVPTGERLADRNFLVFFDFLGRSDFEIVRAPAAAQVLRKLPGHELALVTERIRQVDRDPSQHAGQTAMHRPVSKSDRRIHFNGFPRYTQC